PDLPNFPYTTLFRSPAPRPQRARAEQTMTETYHVGYLATDRRRSPQVEVKAAAAWRDYEEGRAVLVQRRIPGGQFEYVRVERRRSEEHTSELQSPDH